MSLKNRHPFSQSQVLFISPEVEETTKKNRQAPEPSSMRYSAGTACRPAAIFWTEKRRTPGPALLGGFLRTLSR